MLRIRQNTTNLNVNIPESLLNKLALEQVEIAATRFLISLLSLRITLAVKKSMQH